MADIDENAAHTLTGAVKWFDVVKGFGFIVDDEGGPDILLHANVLRNFGQSSVADGARVVVRAQASQRGMQANEVLEITPPVIEELASDDAEATSDTGAGGAARAGFAVPVAPDVPLVPARIKWFDKGKGFGFANVFGSADDIFVHVEILRRFGLADLMPGEAVALKIVEGPRGKMAAEVRSWDFARGTLQCV